MRRFIKIFIAVIWVIIFSELYLMVISPKPMLPRYIKATEFGIRGNMPNQSYWHNSPEYRINITTNSKGLRANQDIPYEKPGGVKRIVVLGDSFGMGYGVELEDTFLSVMEENLEQYGILTEIINLSVSGHGTAEELLMLNNEGIKYDPDLILLAWHKTDVNDNVRSSLYEVKDGLLVRQNESYLPGVKTREFLFSFSAYRWLAGNSHFYNFIRDRVGLMGRQLLASVRSTKHNKESNSVTGEVDTLRAKDELSLALLNEVKRIADSKGANMIILDIPERISRVEFVSSFHYDIGWHQDEYILVSPIKAFNRHQGSLLYWEKSHGHFTPLGCRITGELLASEILNNKLLLNSNKK